MEQRSLGSPPLKITILVEGKTETAFKPHLQAFLAGKLKGQMPRLDMFKYDGRIPKEDKLRRAVDNLLHHSKQPSDAVIALTDVYTGGNDFTSAADAKTKCETGSAKTRRFIPTSLCTTL